MISLVSNGDIVIKNKIEFGTMDIIVCFPQMRNFIMKY